MEQLFFKVTGNFITETARKLLYEQGSFQEAYDLIFDIVGRVELTYEILEGKKKLTGDSDIGIAIEEDNKSELRLSNLIEDMFNQCKELEQENEDYHQKRNFLVEKLLESCPNKAFSYFDEYQDLFGQPLITKDEIIDMGYEETLVEERLHETIKELTLSEKQSYGWLSPTGVFYPVEWGNHDSWARDYVQKHYKVDFLDIALPNQAGDYLINHHWVLLHNPSLGMAKVTKSNSYEPTKAQKDFLFDYYIRRGDEREAMKWFKGE